MKISKKKLGLHALKIISAVGILYFVYTGIDNKEDIWSHIKQVSVFTLLITIVLFAVSKLFSSIRLTYFIRAMGVEISHLTNWKLYLQGMFYNLFLPGGIGGDAYKIFYLNKSNDTKTKDSFWPFLLDRVSGMFSLVILILAFSLFIPSKFFLYQDEVAVGLVSVGFLTVFLLLKLIQPNYLKAFFQTLILSFLVQLTQVVCIVLFLKEMNVTTQYLEYNLLFLVSSIVSIVPITVGGLGLREWTFQYLDYYEIDETIGVLLGTLFFAITLVVSFTGVYYHFKGIRQES